MQESEIPFKKNEELTREDLIEICKLSVVHHSKWGNRDSYSAQRTIQSIYKGLTAGLDFRIITKEIDPNYHSSEYVLIIEFLQPIDFDKLEKGEFLKISTRDEYFALRDPNREGEMFNGEGIDFYDSYTKSYMPTYNSIRFYGIGNDWY
jgi:hypothetical protein